MPYGDIVVMTLLAVSSLNISNVLILEKIQVLNFDDLFGNKNNTI